jgi:putative endonuclease
VKRYFVYIMASRSGTLYTGVTSDLERRVFEHKSKTIPGFTSRYNISILVHFEETNEVEAALAREKQIKGWSRAKKIALVSATNPAFADLSAEWFS